MCRIIRRFISTIPRLPAGEKDFIETTYPEISISDSRIEIIQKIENLIDVSDYARLATYTYRDMDLIDWHPFIKAAIERNPVAYGFLSDKSPENLYSIIRDLENVSIYEGNRLALPDETWNFRRGDGIEKALLMANIIATRDPNTELNISISGTLVQFYLGGRSFRFNSAKSLKRRIRILNFEYSIDPI